MTLRRITEIQCELCAYVAEFTNVATAKSNGWVRDRWSSGELVDLCPVCAKAVLV